MQYLYEDELLVNPTTTRTKYADNKYSEIAAVYDSKYGGVISSTDASGNTTDYKYDECGRIQEIRYPEYNSDNSYKYVRENYTYSRYSRFNNTEYFNVVKNTYKSSTASGYGTIVSSVSEKYDDYGNLVYRKTDAGEEEYLYDNCNRVVGYKNYDDFGTDAMSGQCSYDNLNRVETVTDALGNINHVLYKLLKKEFYFTKSGSTAKENQVKQYYDIFGNIVKTENYSRGINSNPDTNLFTYDLAGNVLTATDGNGNITVFEYDNIGNNIKTILADGTIQENKFTKWGTSGKVSVKDGEKTTSVNNVYADDRGLSTSNYSTGIAIDTKPWYNSYDANGYPVKCIAPNGNERLFTYDECGNIASIQNGSQSEEIFYNFDGQISKHNKYINGRLEHSINYGYDNLERLTSKTIGSNITKYAYDNLGNLTSVTSPSGFARTYSYDRAERLVQLDFDGKTVSYDYNADGTVKKITYPNGITTEYVYDDAKRATSVTTKLGSSVKEQYSYTYDGNGNVLSVSGTKNISYTYDNLNRLKSYTENGVTTVYTYDKRNNLISEICGSNVKTYEYSGDNRLSKTIENDVETVYEYDLNGNLIRRGNDEFAYDEDNKLVYSNVNSVETTYKIGVDGLRSSKTTAGISTDYSIDEAGNVISEGSEEIIIGHMAVAKKIGSSYYYYLYNAHGDVTALTDSTGEIVNNYSYDPWGRIILQTENVPNDIKYAGEYQDSETGLIYLRNRYYDPAIGRFITEDPAKDRLNWYAYCGNNPINFTDSWGLDPALDEYIDSNYYGKKTVTLVIKRPVPNSREAAVIQNGKLNNGHSFIRLDDGNANVRYVGFAPCKQRLENMILGLNVDGKFIDDAKTDWNVAKVYELTDEQYTAISNYINKMEKKKPSYNIESNNCTTFAVNAVKVGGAAVGRFMTIRQHSWTLPNDMTEQLKNYSALPRWLSPEFSAWTVKNTMGNFYGYTPSDAAQDLKTAEGAVLLKYNGSIEVINNNSYYKAVK